MPMFRKRPVMIEARQFHGTAESWLEISEWIGDRPLGTVTLGPGDVRSIEIPTLEGTMRADPGDWIIRGVKGEFYPCKPDIFERTYEGPLYFAPPFPGAPTTKGDEP